MPKIQFIVGLKMKTLSHIPLELNTFSSDINIIFSSLFSIYFLLYCLREFVEISRHLISADHFIDSLYLYIWFDSDIVRRDFMLITLLIPGGGGGCTRPIFGYGWATEGLKPWPCLGQKIPKIHTLFRKTSSILVPSLGQLPQFYY